ncbi:hypothetical protein QQX98_006698 [Neonectria punicea]|uniref:Major facilitator superfamily (MFS) profile domain-containing protein n=1 Tax=Neonectria punicea TaxID=979145 RepID=A0ABR1GZY6_9HYPO
MTHPLTSTAAARLLKFITGNRVLGYPEEQPDFDLARAFPDYINVSSAGNSAAVFPEAYEATRRALTNIANIHEDGEAEKALIQVTWYGPEDPANPKNWTFQRKLVVFFTINYCTFAVYMSSSIFTPSMLELPSIFGVSESVAALGLALFVFGYGFGPLLGAPLSEIPAVGRNPPYLISLALFIIISVPTALARNITSLMALRFLQGFFGSPILATGGASLTDISRPQHIPYALYSWAIFSFIGPAVGPIISGYTVPDHGWRWSLWEIVWIACPAFVMLLLLPETSAAAILYQRAKRLRRMTGDPRFKSPSEVEGRPFRQVLYDAFVASWKINLQDLSIMFTSVYCALVYAIYYLFFEAFPSVYMQIHGMSVGQMGLVYISIPVSVLLGGVPYALFTRFRMAEQKSTGIARPPEDRLIPAVLASLTTPTGLFIFAWTSRSSIHWMVPTIGVALSSSGMAVILQSIFVYISMAYPQYAASLFGVNGFLKATAAAGLTVAAPHMYHNMGVSGGTSLLGGLCVICVAGIFLLYHFGARMRAKSKFTTRNE